MSGDATLDGDYDDSTHQYITDYKGLIVDYGPLHSGDVAVTSPANFSAAAKVVSGGWDYEAGTSRPKRPRVAGALRGPGMGAGSRQGRTSPSTSRSTTATARARSRRSSSRSRRPSSLDMHVQHDGLLLQPDHRRPLVRQRAHRASDARVIENPRAGYPVLSLACSRAASSKRSPKTSSSTRSRSTSRAARASTSTSGSPSAASPPTRSSAPSRASSEWIRGTSA